jgi:hypothetical protein
MLEKVPTVQLNVKPQHVEMHTLMLVLKRHVMMEIKVVKMDVLIFVKSKKDISALALYVKLYVEMTLWLEMNYVMMETLKTAMDALVNVQFQYVEIVWLTLEKNVMMGNLKVTTAHTEETHAQHVQSIAQSKKESLLSVVMA